MAFKAVQLPSPVLPCIPHRCTPLTCVVVKMCCNRVARPEGHIEDSCFALYIYPFQFFLYFVRFARALPRISWYTLLSCACACVSVPAQQKQLGTFAPSLRQLPRTLHLFPCMSMCVCVCASTPSSLCAAAASWRLIDPSFDLITAASS